MTPITAAPAGGRVHVGEERAAAGAVGVPAAVELHLPRAESPGPRGAGDRPLPAVRVADDLDELGGFPAGGQVLAAGQLLDRRGIPRLADDEEGHVVVGVGGGGPGGVHEHLGDGPGAVGFAVPVILRDEGHLARLLAVQAVRRRDHQILDRTVHDARRAEVRAEVAAADREQGPHRGGAVIETAVPQGGRDGRGPAGQRLDRRGEPDREPLRTVCARRGGHDPHGHRGGQRPAPDRRPGPRDQPGGARLFRQTAVSFPSPGLPPERRRHFGQPGPSTSLCG